MTRVLRDPRWLAGLAVAVVFAVACVWLAQWQLDRRVARAERNAAVLQNFDSTPLALTEALPEAGAALRVDQQWQPVSLRGRYGDTGTVLVRNRPQSGSNGYLVATPFRVADPGGPALLLVRGWLPSGADASSPGAVPAAPAGTVDVVARLRTAEEPSSRTAPQGQTYALAADRLLAGTAGDVVTGAYGVVGSEAGRAPAGLAPVPRPDTDPGPHLAYGVQWYLFALAGLGIWAVLAHRHAGEHPEDGPPSHDVAAGAAGPRPSGWVYEPGR